MLRSVVKLLPELAERYYLALHANPRPIFSLARNHDRGWMDTRRTLSAPFDLAALGERA